MNGKTKRCPHCRKLYKLYVFSARDQSACPDCEREAQANMSKGQSWRRAAEQGGGDGTS